MAQPVLAAERALPIPITLGILHRIKPIDRIRCAPVLPAAARVACFAAIAVGTDSSADAAADTASVGFR